MPFLFRKKRRIRLVRRRPRPQPIARATREAARAVILAKVAYWTPLLGVTPGRVAIRNQRSRWGSASSIGNLNFNWRIAKMPEELLDYVIIHELAHLRELNHSPAFWAIVAEHCPEYRTRRKELREYSSTTKKVLE
jgi:predicted metal-dependent hydrolase